jgi:serine/threonine-protein kinase ATR
MFRFIHRFSPKSDRSDSLSIKPWNGDVELSEFIPPVQAALSISSINQGGSKDFFPRTVPRMRAFSSKIGIMHSKAKPKKLKAYAVPGTYTRSKGTAEAPGGASATTVKPGDIGEIHFLVKQEAKGDLRKDARVQDLNNVINRLMASSSDSGSSSRRRRRLHLRTFAVTCLSEDTGILEWIPDTDSLRNLITSSYNPQTSQFCSRRRGTRLANFGDVTLRSQYERAQNKFFKEGDLSRAATLFEELCLKPYPPLLYWWFVQKFHDPHAWYEARNRFTLSAAAWSAVGHVIGLGDRHSENILVDTSNGDCVHVDFDW